MTTLRYKITVAIEVDILEQEMEIVQAQIQALAQDYANMAKSYKSIGADVSNIVNIEQMAV